MPAITLTGIGTDGSGNATTIFAISGGTYSSLSYTVTWSQTGGGSSGSISVLGVAGPTRSGAGTWTETLAIPVAAINDGAGLTVAWSVIYTGSGGSSVTTATLTINAAAVTFAKRWSWDAFRENLCMAWVDNNDALQVSAFRGPSARLSGRTLPAWDTPIQLATHCSELNLGYYPLGSVYLCYTPRDASGNLLAPQYRINNAQGAGAWSAAAAINYNLSGGLPSTNSGPVPRSQSGGDGGNYFVGAGQTLFYFNNVYTGAEQRPFQSQSTDGTKWDWNLSGNTTGGQSADGLRFQSNNPYSILTPYSQGNMINPPAVAYSLTPQVVQDGMLSRPVRLADGTLVQLAYCSTYYKIRPISAGASALDWGGSTTNPSVALSVPVPATGTIADVSLIFGWLQKFRWIVGTLETNNKPVRVTFPIPSIGISGTLVPIIGIDVSVVNAKYLKITIGSGPVFPNSIAPQNAINGSGRLTYIWDNRAALNAWWAPNYEFSYGMWNSLDGAAIKAAAGGNITLPISYSGTADSITINGAVMDLNYECDAEIGATTTRTWTIVSGAHSTNLATPNYDWWGPVTDATWLAAMQSAAGTNCATTLQVTTTCNGSGAAPWLHYDIWHTSARFRYTDAAAYFRLMRSRDNGAHWEYAADGAPISGLDTLRQFQNTPYQIPLMPMLAAQGQHVFLGWVQGGNPQMLTSADVGETWV